MRRHARTHSTRTSLRWNHLLCFEAAVNEGYNYHRARSIPLVAFRAKGPEPRLHWRDSARLWNKIYGKGCCHSWLLLIVSQLSKKPISLKEPAVKFIYWLASWQNRCRASARCVFEGGNDNRCEDFSPQNSAALLFEDSLIIQHEGFLHE